MDGVLAVLGKIGFDWRVAFANLVNFLIIFWILKRYAFGPIARVIEKRKKVIQEGIDKSQEAETALIMAQEKAKDIIHEAQKESQVLIQNASIKSSEILVASHERASKEADQVITDARIAGDAIKQKMQEEVHTYASDLVIQAVEKVLQESIDEKKNADIVAQAIDSLHVAPKR